MRDQWVKFSRQSRGGGRYEGKQRGFKDWMHSWTLGAKGGGAAWKEGDLHCWPKNKQEKSPRGNTD